MFQSPKALRKLIEALWEQGSPALEIRPASIFERLIFMTSSMRMPTPLPDLDLSISYVKEQVRLQLDPKFSKTVWRDFGRRLDTFYPRLLNELQALYGALPDFPAFIVELLVMACKS